tara:strand:- start:248 stop:604 length:357 start_codon:yes stop_codon:yes gene_type:complete
MTALLVLLVAAVVLAAVGKVHGAFLTHQRSSPAAWHEVNARAHKDCACLLHTDKRKQTKQRMRFVPAGGALSGLVRDGKVCAWHALPTSFRVPFHSLRLTLESGTMTDSWKTGPLLKM